MYEFLAILATLSIGTFAGSLLLEGSILVPYWKRMQHSEFIRLHQTLGPYLFRYFAPLTSLAVVLSVIIAVLDRGSTIQWVGAALLNVATFLIFFAYFKNANARFKSGEISEDLLRRELSHWEVWHWFRTCLMLLAFTLSVLGHCV